jgi:hypothetical protein
MTPIAARRLARGLNVLTLAAPLLTGLALLVLFWPPPAWRPPACDQIAAPQSRPASRPSEPDLAVIWERDLRQPLVDPVPVPPAPIPEPKIAVQLVGTAVEPQRCYGVFALSSGTIVVRPVGATLEGCDVIAIERGRARLRNGGREYELKIPWYDRLSQPEPEHGQ